MSLKLQNQPQSRFEDKLVDFSMVCPQNGTAVLKGAMTVINSVFIWMSDRTLRYRPLVLSYSTVRDFNMWVTSTAAAVVVSCCYTYYISIFYTRHQVRISWLRLAAHSLSYCQH